MKLVAIGGGNYSLNDAEKPYNLDAIDDEIVKLANKKCPRLLYLGFNIRADYYFSNIKKIFMAKGCQCEYLRFSEFDNQKTVENKFKRADIIFLPGGNTLDYMKKIRKFGLGDYIKLASERGAVLAGISAGAIIYFDAGCSDSRKSETVPKKYTKVNGVQLRVDHVGVLGVLAGPFPGEDVVGAALGHPVVAGGDDDVVLRDDAGAHLGVGVLAPPGRQHGNAHEIFVPGDVVLALH